MKQVKLFAASLIAVICLFSPTTVLAAEECTTTTGSYGQTSTTCKVLGVTTEPHAVVGAGVGDVSFLLLAGALTTVSAVFFGVSWLTKNIYWFD